MGLFGGKKKKMGDFSKTFAKKFESGNRFYKTCVNCSSSVLRSKDGRFHCCGRAWK
jgi:hypothetical protein